MKFGQLIEYNIKTFSLKTHRQNVVEELVPESKKLKLGISLDESKFVETEVLTTCFYLT